MDDIKLVKKVKVKMCVAVVVLPFDLQVMTNSDIRVLLYPCC